MLRVVIIDDDPMYVSLARALADTVLDVEVVASASHGLAATAVVKAHQPDVVLLDLALPDVDGLTLIPEVAAAASGAPVVVVTGNDYAPLREMATDAGAAGLLAKNPMDDLFTRLRQILAESAQA